MTLQQWTDAVWAMSQTLGLDPADTEFRLVPRERLWAIAATGLPDSPPHWTHGRDYWRFRQSQETGAAHLYEIVVRADPCIAYLDAANADADQELVVAHVAGHADLFKHHVAVADQRRDWPAILAAGSERVRDYQARWGGDLVETVWSAALALQEHVSDDTTTPPAPANPSPYAGLWDAPSRPVRQPPPRYALPTADVLGFIAAHGDLAPWAQDCLGLVRGTALYFAPQRRTKWIQEAYATWVEHRVCEALDWPNGARVSGALSSARVQWSHPLTLNWYDAGYRLLAWYEAQMDAAAVIALARSCADAQAIDRLVTAASVAELELYPYHWLRAPGEIHAVRLDADWRQIRSAWQDAVVERPPRVRVESVEQGVLVLAWEDPVPPDLTWATATLAAAQQLWGAPVRMLRPDGPPLTAKEGSS